MTHGYDIDLDDFETPLIVISEELHSNYHSNHYSFPIQCSFKIIRN